MASVLDVAQYILRQRGSLDTMKLEKLCYYCQAWNLAWGFGKLFPERIEAWTGGPIIPELFARHRGNYSVSDVGGDASEIDRMPEVKDRIDRVLAFYGDKSGSELSELTHLEDPWFNARQGLAATQRSNAEITDAAMIEYYRRLLSVATS